MNLELKYRTVSDFDREFEKIEAELRENGCYKALLAWQQHKDTLRGLAYVDKQPQTGTRNIGLLPLLPCQGMSQRPLERSVLHR